MLTAASEAIRVHGFHAEMIFGTVAGAVAPVLAMSNPTMRAQRRTRKIALVGAEVVARKERGGIRIGLILLISGAAFLGALAMSG
jgi:hypothetical protein